MKAIRRLALAGTLLIAGYVSAQNAQMKLTETALSRALQNSAAREFLGANKVSLAGVSKASDLLALINKLPAAEAAFVAAKINAYDKAISAASGAAMPEKIGESVFKPNGQILVAANAVGKTEKDAASNTLKGQKAPRCGDGSPAVILAKFDGITPVLAEAAQEQGILTEANCAIGEIQSKPAGRNLGKAVGCMVTNGAGQDPVGSPTRVMKGAGCLGGALEPDNTTGPVVPAMKTGDEAKVHLAAFKQLSEKGKGCEYLQ